MNRHAAPLRRINGTRKLPYGIYGYHLFLPVFEFTAPLNALAGFSNSAHLPQNSSAGDCRPGKLQERSFLLQ